MTTDSLLKSAQPPLSRAWPGIAFGTLSALSAIALLAASSYLITRAAEQPPILYLSIAVVGVRAFALARAFFRYLERLSSHDAAFRQLAVVRTELYRRLVRIAPAGLGRTNRGDLLSRVIGDVDTLQDLPLRVVQPLVIAGLAAVLSVTGVAFVSPAAALVLALALIAAFVVGTLLANRLAATNEKTLASRRGDLSALVLDTVQNLDVLTAFDALDGQLARVSQADADLRRASLRRARTTGVVAAVMSLLSGAAVLVTLPLVAPAIAAGTLSGPEAALVVLVPIAVFEVVGAVPTAVLAWRRVRSSGARVDSAVPAEVPVGVVVDEADDDLGAEQAERPGRPQEAQAETVADAPIEAAPVIELSRLVATWPGADEPTLRGVSLRLEDGDRVVVEGPSGAGKSTLAAVLVRFLDYEGTYRLRGADVRASTGPRVRQTVGLIEQSPYLFDDTVRQNLLFARDTAGDDELEAVLERVGLGEWLRERGGLEARLGERGALVSGGQAQRISFARALLRGFPVLVLDEPAAGLDPELATALVDDVLRTAADDGTTLVLISHVAVADDLVTRRLRLDDGVVTELPRAARPLA